MHVSMLLAVAAALLSTAGAAAEPAQHVLLAQADEAKPADSAPAPKKTAAVAAPKRAERGV